jgi:hypothetical protein
MAKPTIAELEEILANGEGSVEIGPDGSLISSDFRKELASLLNRHSKENGCDTPDFILAKYLQGALHAFDVAVTEREKWYGRPCGDGKAILSNIQPTTY